MVGVDDVINKLSTVIDPDLKKDIVSMGMIKDLELDSGNLKFTLELTTPAPVRRKQPRSSTWARSPVRSQPSTSASAVRSGSRQ